MTYNPAYAYNRAFQTGLDITPAFGPPLIFKSVTAVANYYGVHSVEAKLAPQYFTPGTPPGATMIFFRDPRGQRSHLLGGNLSSMSSSQMAAITGPISLTFDGFQYSGVVQPGATDLTQLALNVRNALHSYLPTVAQLIGASITPHTITFVGSLAGEKLTVTSGDTPVVGGILHGTGVDEKDFASEIILKDKGQPNEWSTFAAAAGYVPPGTVFTETFGDLNPGTASARIYPGLRLTNSSGQVPDLTALISRQPNGHYIVNNDPLVAPEDMGVTPPSLDVQPQQIGGATQNNYFLLISPSGAFDFNAIPATMSWASDPVADTLRLAQASGGHLSAISGYSGQIATFMNNLVSILTGMGTGFDSLQSINDEIGTSLATWAANYSAHHPSDQMDYLPSGHVTPPAGVPGFDSREQANLIAELHAHLSAHPHG